MKMEDDDDTGEGFDLLREREKREEERDSDRIASVRQKAKRIAEENTDIFEQVLINVFIEGVSFGIRIAKEAHAETVQEMTGRKPN